MVWFLLENSRMGLDTPHSPPDYRLLPPITMTQAQWELSCERAMDAMEFGSLGPFAPTFLPKVSVTCEPTPRPATGAPSTTDSSS